MKSKSALRILTFACLFILLFSSLPAQAGYAAETPEPGIPASPQAGGEIVMVARDVIDLKWDPTGYPQTPGKYKRWELHRGTSPDALSKIAGSTDQTTGFYRDRDRALNTTYYYSLYVVRCVDPCLTSADEKYLQYFVDSVTTGVIGGTLYHSLELGEGVYEFAYNGITSSVSLDIENGSALVINSKTTVTKKPDISHGAIFVNSGSLTVSGANLTDVMVTVGESGGSESNCVATFKNAVVTGPSLVVNAACRLDFNGGSGTAFIMASDYAALTIQNALLDGGIDIEKHATATLSNNQITGRIEVSGYHDPGDPKPVVFLYKNLITTPYKHNVGILVDYGATVYMGENTLTFTGVVDDETAILLQAWDAGTKLVAKSNRIENAKIFLAWNPTVEISDNVLIGSGSAITIGCPFCGTGPQATGPIERNTLQSGWGFEMWDGSQSVTLRHNCIRGNDPGMTVVNTLPVNLDARENYWGDASGPLHAGNPPGIGDEIVGAKVDYNPWDIDPTNCKETPPPMLRDLYPIGLEVVQSVQTMYNSVSLVTGKPAWVRVYAQSSRGFVANVGCVLRGYRGSTLLGTLDPITPNIVVRGSTSITTLRENMFGSWNFDLPPDWIAEGNLRLVAEINPGLAVPDLIAANNTIERNVIFATRRAMRVAFVPVRYHTLLTDDLPNQDDILPMMWYMRRLYPMATIEGELIAAPMEWTGSLANKLLQGIYDSTIQDRLMDRLNLFNANRPPDQRIDQVYGVFPDSAGMTYCISDPRWAGGKGRSAYCIVHPIHLAHEIGHNLGLRHPNTPDACDAKDSDTDWPFTTATIQDVGVDILSNDIKPARFHDIMSYCAAGQRWISPFHANKLFQADGNPQPATESPEAQVNYLFVRGQVDITGTVTLLPAWQLSMVSPPVNPPEGSQYCVELQSAAGTTLSSYCFDPRFYIYELGLSVDTTTFEIALPLVEGGANIVVNKFGDPAPAAQASASANAPSVAVLYPNGGEILSGSVTISWEGSDADLDALFYHLLYSEDGGATWLPVTEYLTATTYTIDTAYLPGSADGRFRVIASDGFHTSYDDSDASFTTPDNVPLVGISAPEDGGHGMLPLNVSGAAYDLEEGELPDGSLIWSSDLDGPLGAGPNLNLEGLTLGLHHLTLTAIDSQGHTAAQSITYTVLEPWRVFLPALNR